jgi:hypothetical protein
MSTRNLFFFIRLVGVGVQLVPLGTADNDWPIAPLEQMQRCDILITSKFLAVVLVVLML